jgi:hypothetical protein
MSWVSELKKEAIYRGRFTPAGRRLLSSAAVVVQPVDWYARRRAAVRYNKQFPSTRMTAANGYVVLPSGSLPGTQEIIDTCRRLFESKQAKPGTIPTGGKGKRSFLRNVLDDGDLRANPVLVDFALSDSLFSIVTNYLGVIPSLNRVDLIYSVPRPTPEEHISSQLFHQDHEGLRQAKVFLNIFDVGEQHGPFTLIPASRSEPLLLAIRQQRREAGAQHEGHYRDDEVGAHGGLAAAVRLTGPAGTAAVVDTSRCLHAGSRVRTGHFRLCLYIQYCTTREKANTFNAARFRNDLVRWLAVKRHAAATP